LVVSTRILILPGLYDSGTEHWQSYWERSDPSFVRVVQNDWSTPARKEWVATLERAVEEFGPDILLVAHSNACALVDFWAAETKRSVRGALLVAPSDSEAPSYPVGPTGWQPMPRTVIPFPSIVVASSNDEFVTVDRAKEFADSWGSRLVMIGEAGHINSASGLGAWTQGRKLLEELIQETEPAI
jgi:uncharacterized protein